MPRRSKGARLYWRKPKGPRKGIYVIRDGADEFSTRTDDRGAAEAALRRYLIDKDAPRQGAADDLLVTDALAYYGEKHAIETASPERIGYAIDALSAWWEGRTIAEVTADTCKEYMIARRRGYLPTDAEKPTRPVQTGTIRRELGCMRSALIYCRNAGVISAVPVVWLPEAPAPKDRWLTRGEVATLIRAARADKRTKYLAKFILVSLYTGSRKEVVLRSRFLSNALGGFVDLINGLFHRKGKGQRITKKQAPTVSLPPRLLGHLTRWRENGATWLIEIEGAGVANIKNDWEAIRKRADLPEVTPHTLRHTAITWAMQGGANIWHISGFFGVSLDTLEKTYAHHHPDHMKTAVEAANRMGKHQR